MNLYRQELKSYLKTMLFWILGIIFMVGAGIGKYEAFSAGGSQDISVIMKSLPKAFIAIFGLAGIPIGRFGGALSSVRADDLAAVPLKALVARNPGLDWADVDEVIY